MSGEAGNDNGDDLAIRMIEAWQEIARLSPRMKVVMPDRLIRFKERMHQLQLDGGHWRPTDHDLFYRISSVLANRQTPMAMGEISEALGVPPNSATRMVDWLVRSGYAERMPDPEDRRVIRVTLTQEGHSLHRALVEFAMDHTRDLLSRFTQEEQQLLVALLQKLATVLKEEAAGS